jgi:protein SCO1/2
MLGVPGRKALKLLFLIATLVIPVAIYLFLKGFGENHYAVRVYFEKGIPADSADCFFDQKEHKIDISGLNAEMTGQDNLVYFSRKLSVIDINTGYSGQTWNTGYPLNRVSDVFAEQESVQFILIRPLSPVGNIKQSGLNDRFIYVYGNTEVITAFARCQLILLDFSEETDQNSRRLVLVDSKGRIRGYYSLNDFGDMDRMILEMKIILSEEF